MLRPAADDVAVEGDGGWVRGHVGGGVHVDFCEAEGEVADFAEGGEEDDAREVQVEEGGVFDARGGAGDAVSAPVQDV